MQYVRAAKTTNFTSSTTMHKGQKKTKSPFMAEKFEAIGYRMCRFK